MAVPAGSRSAASLRRPCAIYRQSGMRSTITPKASGNVAQLVTEDAHSAGSL
jgi:hypothetical protein